MSMIYSPVDVENNLIGDLTAELIESTDYRCLRDPLYPTIDDCPDEVNWMDWVHRFDWMDSVSVDVPSFEY